jgi:broad specificity phosphatase PhoE
LLADQKLVPYRLRSREPVSSLLIQNVSDICEFIESFTDHAKSKIHVRFYTTLPFGPIYVIDDEVYWGMYLSHMDSMAGPVFREPSTSRLGREIISSFHNVWQDASDRTGMLSVGINAVGRIRLRQFGDRFERHRWSAVYSSPARRCTETLAELLKDEANSAEIRDELRERSMGELEGFSKYEYDRSLPQYRGVDVLNSFHARPTGGESYCDVFRRVSGFIEGICSSVSSGKAVIVCTHDTTIRMIRMLLENLPIETAVSLEVNNAEPIYYVSRS